MRRCANVLLAAAAGIIMLLTPSNAAEEPAAPFNYKDYALTLAAYVDSQGMVNYEALKANRGTLDAFTAGVENLDPAVYAAWSEKDKIAFWINAYNALTLQAIIDHYPIKSSFIASLRFPKNSIRQIPGVWDKLKFRVMGREMTLDQIEHANLRRNFVEPRIHVALVCAAIGCPPLRNEPFAGSHLDAQLDDQTRGFLKNPLKFRIDRRNDSVHLSSIFKWFGEDFIKTYGVDGRFTDHSRPERAILNFISNYLDNRDIEYLSTAEYSIEYLDYDWSLNEQPKR